MSITHAPPDHWALTRERPPVVIAVVNWNRRHLLRLCLSSLQKHTDYPYHRVCVFDQGSSDGSVDLLRSLGDGIDVIYSHENIGFTLASNAIIERYPAWDVVLLNNDVRVTEGWLSALVATAVASDRIGLVGARLVSPSGILQEAGNEVFADGQVQAYGRGAGADDPQFQERRVVDYCSAACLLVKRAVLDRCGALDRTYEPGYYEDVDLAFRARAAGFAVMYEPRCVVIHEEHGSYGGDAAAALVRRHRETFHARWAGHLATQRQNPFELADTGRPRLLLATDLLPGNTVSARRRRVLQLIRALSGTFEVAYLNATTAGVDRYAAMLEDLGVVPFYVPLRAEPGVPGLDEENLVRVNDFPIAVCGNPDGAQFLRSRLPREAFDSTTLAVDVGMDVDVVAAATRSGATCFVVATETQRRQVIEAMPKARCALLPFHPEPSLSPPPSREACPDVVVIGDNFDSPPAAAVLVGMLEAIVPMLRERLLHCTIRVGGGSLPPALLAGRLEGLEAMSSAAPIGPVLDRARMVVIPQHWCNPDTLSTISEARARGIPIVTSSAVLEVAGLADAESRTLSAETPDGFAELIVRIYTDSRSWNALAGAQALTPAAQREGLAKSMAAWITDTARLPT